MKAADEPGRLGRLVELVVDRYQEIESTLPLLSRELSHSERKALRVVAAQRRVTIGGVGAALRLPASTTTWLVGGMAERGIFKKRRDDKDRRRVWIELSDKGEALARLMERIPDRIAADILYKLEPEKRGLFAELAGLALSKMDKAGSLKRPAGAAPAGGSGDSGD